MSFAGLGDAFLLAFLVSSGSSLTLYSPCSLLVRFETSTIFQTHIVGTAYRDILRATQGGDIFESDVDGAFHVVRAVCPHVQRCIYARREVPPYRAGLENVGLQAMRKNNLRNVWSARPCTQLLVDSKRCQLPYRPNEVSSCGFQCLPVSRESLANVVGSRVTPFDRFMALVR